MGKSVEYYLSKGFAKEYAEYFSNGRRTITSVLPNDDFTLSISFDNGENRIFDVKPLLKQGTVFEPFTKLENFKRVYIDDSHCISWDIDPNIDSKIVWNNKVDLCPDSCYVESKPVNQN